jgi:hypothetical protein
MPQSPQTLKNHTRLLPSFHFFVLPVLFVNVVLAIYNVYQSPETGGAWWALVVALALLTLALVARTMTLTVQDRVIRLEMRLRLQEVLPPDLRNRVHELTPRQLVALRFASDAEMPDLVREVLVGHLATTKAIKGRVKDWQADYLRC